jgi:Holliday junction DNA helicase RuvA
MIGRLRGFLVEQEGSAILVDCNGVGYDVTVSAYTAASLPPVGEQVTVRIYTQVLENRIALYGFGTAPERELFDLLITVKKVGPASAMGILSGGSGPEQIASLIARGEINQLTRLRGVGKKTAEMLVVELRVMCELRRASGAAGGRPRPAPVASRPASQPGRLPVLEEVAQALLQLGWRPAAVDKAVSELDAGEDATLESLLRQALRSMPR